jgi:hypothetical protein
VQWISLIGFSAFVVASLVAGGRLLLLARRTRQIPEAALGTALFLGGGIGWALLVFGLQVLPETVAPTMRILGNLCIHIGGTALAVGTAQMFRPGQLRARAAVALIAAVYAVSFWQRLLDPTALPAPVFVFWTSTLAGAATYGWSATESWRWHARLRRRLTIGLAEADGTRRMGLWAAASAIAVAIHVVTAANRFVRPEGLHPVALALSSLLGFGAALCLWLAFFRRPRVRSGARPEVEQPS